MKIPTVIGAVALLAGTAVVGSPSPGFATAAPSCSSAAPPCIEDPSPYKLVRTAFDVTSLEALPGVVKQTNWDNMLGKNPDPAPDAQTRQPLTDCADSSVPTGAAGLCFVGGQHTPPDGDEGDGTGVTGTSDCASDCAERPAGFSTTADSQGPNATVPN